MALMDTVKQLMKGRSEVVERGIDTAIGHLGRYSEQLKRSAEVAKAQARNLDPDRDAASGTVVVPDATTPPGPAPTADPTAAPPPPVVTDGPSLRGDLVDPDEPPSDPPAR
jgi:hypothetical protein